MQFLHKLTENLSFKRLKWRRSRRIGLMSERKTTDSRAEQTFDLVSVSPRLISSYIRGNLEENVIFVWRYCRDDDIVQLLRYKNWTQSEKLNIGVDLDGENNQRLCEVKEGMNGRGNNHIDFNLDMYNGNLILDKNERMIFNINRSSVDQSGMKTGNDVNDDEIEFNINHSARDDSILHSHHHVTRSRSEEKYNKLVICEDKIFDDIFIKFLPLDRNFQFIKKSGESGKEASRFEIEAWSVKYQKKRYFVDERKPKIGRSELHLTKKKEKDGFSIYQDDFDADTKDPVLQFNDDIFYHPRFGYYSNLEYLKSVDSITKADFKKKCRIELFISPSTLSYSLSLAHKKTEMLVACLRTYFNQVADIEVMWVHQLKFHLPRKPLNSYFPLTISDVLQLQLNDCRVVLYVSHDVSVLLRHPNTCFLTTLAYCAGVSRHQLMILPLFVKPRFSKSSRTIDHKLE